MKWLRKPEKLLRRHNTDGPEAAQTKTNIHTWLCACSPLSSIEALLLFHLSCLSLNLFQCRADGWTDKNSKDIHNGLTDFGKVS